VVVEGVRSVSSLAADEPCVQAAVVDVQANDEDTCSSSEASESLLGNWRPAAVYTVGTGADGSFFDSSSVSADAGSLYRLPRPKFQTFV